MSNLCIAAKQENTEVAGCCVAFTHLKQKAGHVAYHVLEKAVPADAENEDFVLTPETASEDSADLGPASPSAFIGTGEGGKIVLPEEAGGGRGHGGLIQRVRMVMQVTAQERRANLFSPDTVLVSFCNRIVTRVEGCRALADFVDADVIGQEVVECLAEIGFGNWTFEIESGTNGKGVNAGVGASAAHNVDGLAFQLPESFFDAALDGGEAGLDLPAMVGSAVVADEDTQTAHDSGGTGTGLNDGQALGAERTHGGFVGRNFQSCECDARNTDVGASTAAVDDRSGREHFGSGCQE